MSFKALSVIPDDAIWFQLIANRFYSQLTQADYRNENNTTLTLTVCWLCYSGRGCRRGPFVVVDITNTFFILKFTSFITELCLIRK